MSSLRRYFPPVLFEIRENLLGRPGFYGNYPTFQAAAEQSSGYKTDIGYNLDFISKLDAASIPNGTALAALLLAPHDLRVLDFGGGLAISYFRYRRFLKDRVKNWAVVDLPDVVAHGKQAFAKDDVLSFHLGIAEAVAATKPNVIISDSVLFYIDDVYGLMAELNSVGADWVILDRVPNGTSDRFMTQRVPASAGGGRRTIRITRRDGILSAFPDYKLEMECDIGTPEGVHPYSRKISSYSCFAFRRAP